MTKKRVASAKAHAQKSERLTPVSEKSIKSSAARVTAQGTLVSAEIQYVINALGRSATQQQIDECVIAVRKMKWADIVAGMD